MQAPGQVWASTSAFLRRTSALSGQALRLRFRSVLSNERPHRQTYRKAQDVGDYLQGPLRRPAVGRKVQEIERCGKAPNRGARRDRQGVIHSAVFGDVRKVR